MRTKLFAILMLVSILIAGCGPAATQAPTQVPPTPKTIILTGVPQVTVET